MKNLKELNNEQLLLYYEEMCGYEEIDHKFGCSDIVEKFWKPIWEKFEKEFKERKITFVE